MSGLAAASPAEPLPPEPEVDEAEEQARAEARRLADERAYCRSLLQKVVARARVDLSLPPYFRPFAAAEWARTIEGCRADLNDGRFCEVAPGEVRFGNIKFPRRPEVSPVSAEVVSLRPDVALPCDCEPASAEVETLYTANRHDIPAMLRALADDIEAGRQSATAAICVLQTGGEGVEMLAWGDCDLWKAQALAHTASVRLAMRDLHPELRP